MTSRRSFIAGLAAIALAPMLCGASPLVEVLPKRGRYHHVVEFDGKVTADFYSDEFMENVKRPAQYYQYASHTTDTEVHLHEPTGPFLIASHGTNEIRGLW